MNVTGLNLWSVNIGSGNGLVPSGNKPLPEQMLTQISVAIKPQWVKTIGLDMFITELTIFPLTLYILKGFKWL